jgi:EAL domain-containing protein (putative c-di-GMP-specific phosphodiesterase class I)
VVAARSRAAPPVPKRGERHWGQRIQSALAEDRLILHAQRIHPCATSQAPPLFAELLVRLREDGDRMLLPGAFLPQAARHDLAGAVDRRVVDRATGWLGRNQDRLPAGSLFAVNLSAATVEDEDFAGFVVESIAAANLDPRLLCFELKETEAITQLAAVQGFMRRLAGLGCAFALDDVRGDPSSVSSLRTLDLDFVKIDAPFVRSIAEDPLSRIIVNYIVQMNQALGRQVIADQVAEARLAEELRPMNVDFVQGFGLSAPAPIDDLLHPNGS